MTETLDPRETDETAPASPEPPATAYAAGRLAEISVRDLALIEKLRIEFEPGLNVLTGETGAGKSLLIDALGLAIGARADTSLVRHGSDAALVEALFGAAHMRAGGVRCGAFDCPRGRRNGHGRATRRRRRPPRGDPRPARPAASAR